MSIKLDIEYYKPRAIMQKMIRKYNLAIEMTLSQYESEMLGSDYPSLTGVNDTHSVHVC